MFIRIPKLEHVNRRPYYCLPSVSTGSGIRCFLQPQLGGREGPSQGWLLPFPAHPVTLPSTTGSSGCRPRGRAGLCGRGPSMPINRQRMALPGRNETGTPFEDNILHYRLMTEQLSCVSRQQDIDLETVQMSGGGGGWSPVSRPRDGRVPEDGRGRAGARQVPRPGICRPLGDSLFTRCPHHCATKRRASRSHSLAQNTVPSESGPQGTEAPPPQRWPALAGPWGG